MSAYRLLTIWRIKAPLQDVFDLVSDSLRWPEWWPGAERVEELRTADADGTQGVRQYTWQGSLPYQLRFCACTVRVEAPCLLEAAISGDLEGAGRWAFRHEGDVTTVSHEWQVRTTKFWMNLAAPLARQLFTKNHGRLMTQGAHALAFRLQGQLLEARTTELPAPPGRALAVPSNDDPAHDSVDWMTGVAAGIAAGIVATGVQILLWWSAGYPPWEMLLRDARLAAAIVMGRGVLPPPATFDWQAMLAASAVHFALSAIYGLIVAPLVTRLRPLSSALAGITFGLSLYVINMYGFTMVFPWFVASRDWITALAHAAFGATAALWYCYWRKRN